MKLPLEYNKLCEYFDALGCASNTSTNRVVEKILKKHGVKTVLDLTCGTGSQVIWLSKKGYKIVGSDLSPALLKIAERKLKKEKLKAKLIQGDMRTQKVGRFDAVITIFNAIGHLSKKDFEKAIKNIYCNLNKGGIYVFDIFNLNSLNDQDLSSLTMDNTRTVGDQKIRQIQYSLLDKKKGRLISHDCFYFDHKIIKGNFSMQIYTAKELREMLKRNGFKILNQYGLDGSRFSDQKTKEILTVAQKV